MDTPSEQELLANLLTAASYGKPRDEEAEQLMKRFGSLSNVFSADRRTLENCGLSDTQAALLLSVRPIAQRSVLAHFGASPDLSDRQVLEDYIRALYIGVRNERFILLCLNRQNRLIEAQTLVQGTLRGIRLQPRTLIESVVRSGAARVIFCHNHPGGQVEFSAADIRSTRIFWNQLKALGVELVDHMLCAGGSVVSMRETCKLDDTFYFPPDVGARGPARRRNAKNPDEAQKGD